MVDITAGFDTMTSVSKPQYVTKREPVTGMTVSELVEVALGGLLVRSCKLVPETVSAKVRKPDGRQQCTLHSRCRDLGGIHAVLHRAVREIVQGRMPTGTVMRFVMRELVDRYDTSPGQLAAVADSMLFDDVDSVLGRPRALELLCWGVEGPLREQVSLLAKAFPRTPVPELRTLAELSLQSVRQQERLNGA